MLQAFATCSLAMSGEQIRTVPSVPAGVCLSTLILGVSQIAISGFGKVLFVFLWRETPEYTYDRAFATDRRIKIVPQHGMQQHRKVLIGDRPLGTYTSSGSAPMPKFPSQAFGKPQCGP